MNDPWMQLWRAVLSVGATAERRLLNGQAWDRSGRVTQVRASAGLLRGRVQGASATPFGVDIHVPVFTDGQWRQVYEVLAGQARHHAHLLAGQAPLGVVDQLHDRDLSLMPKTAELDTDCRCGDSVWPCVHVAAVWEAASNLLHDDPFILFALRGRGRQQLMSELAEQRRGATLHHGTAVSHLPDQGWSTLNAPLSEVTLPVVDYVEPSSHDLLRLLGDPPGWEGRLSAPEVFVPLIRSVRVQEA